jgi:tRNA (guanine9-N1)-methyltransferase
MYCYAVNGRSANPAHLWLTGCNGEMVTHLQRIPGYGNWIIEKEAKPYLESFEDGKENLVYLTADAETVLDDLDMSKIYIIGGLVDRNRWKGITQKKAAEQGIQSAKLPIGNYLKMSSSQVRHKDFSCFCLFCCTNVTLVSYGLMVVSIYLLVFVFQI